MAAFATHDKIPPERLAIKRIAIIPAADPRWYSFENAAPPVGYPFQYWVNKLNSKDKAKLFNDRLNSQRCTLGRDLTDEVASALRDNGFTVEILEDLTRPVDDPDNVDYEKVASDADVILHLWISEVGMYSSHLSRDYIPRVNASAKLFVTGRDDNLLDVDLYYGVDAKKGKDWAILPDAKYAYRSFDGVMTNAEEVRAAFSVGVQEISKRMSDQIVAGINASR